MIPRFHCPTGLAPGACVELPTAAAHHARKVLRLNTGDAVVLFDGVGGEWSARLEIHGPKVRAALDAFIDPPRDPALHVTLTQGLPAADKMDWVVQKGVELGVAAIQPVAARRSVVRLTGERAEKRVRHWQQVAVAACEQCGRNRVPEVADLLDLPQYLGRPARENALRLALVPGGGRRLADVPVPAGAVEVLIGPEGGWEEAEERAVAVAGFVPVTLGPRVLRTETAGAAALAAIMTLWGDW